MTLAMISTVGSRLSIHWREKTLMEFGEQLWDPTKDQAICARTMIYKAEP